MSSARASFLLLFRLPGYIRARDHHADRRSSSRIATGVATAAAAAAAAARAASPFRRSPIGRSSLRRAGSLLLPLLLPLLLLCGAATVVRADPAIERAAQGIFHNVMSPYCPGLLLANCPTTTAEALRNEIRADLRQGKPAAAIEADIHQRFGAGTRAAPAFEGLGRIVWIAPLLLFGAATWLLAAWLRRCGRPPRDSPSADAVSSAPPGPDSALARRLDDELESL